MIADEILGSAPKDPGPEADADPLAAHHREAALRLLHECRVPLDLDTAAAVAAYLMGNRHRTSAAEGLLAMAVSEEVARTAPGGAFDIRRAIRGAEALGRWVEGG